MDSLSQHTNVPLRVRIFSSPLTLAGFLLVLVVSLAFVVLSVIAFFDHYDDVERDRVQAQKRWKLNCQNAQIREEIGMDPLQCFEHEKQARMNVAGQALVRVIRGWSPFSLQQLDIWIDRLPTLAICALLLWLASWMLCGNSIWMARRDAQYWRLADLGGYNGAFATGSSSASMHNSMMKKHI